MSYLMWEILSMLGAALVGAAYIFGILGWIRKDSVLQHSLNIVGCILLATYAYHNHTCAFLALNILWGIAALFGVKQALTAPRKQDEKP